MDITATWSAAEVMAEACDKLHLFFTFSCFTHLLASPLPCMQWSVTMGLPSCSASPHKSCFVPFNKTAINLLVPFHCGKMTGALHPQGQKVSTARESCPTNSLCAATVPSTKLPFHSIHRAGRAVPVTTALESIWGSRDLFVSGRNLAAPTAAQFLPTLSQSGGAGCVYDSPRVCRDELH